MRRSSSNFKAYGAISPWVQDNLKHIGRIRISDTNGKRDTSDKAIGDIVGGGGSTDVFTPNKSVTSDEYGRIAVSFVSSAELHYVAGATSNIQTQINEIRVLTNENKSYVDDVIAGGYSTHTANLNHFVSDMYTQCK